MASEGDFWRRQRKMIQPAFHRDMIANMVAAMHNTNADLSNRWRALAQRGESINLTEELSNVTLHIILKAIFGNDFAAIDAMPGGNPFMLLAPGLAIIITVLCVNFVGDGLRDALDPEQASS